MKREAEAVEDRIRIALLDDDAAEINKTEQMLSSYGEMHPGHKYIITCHTQVKTFMEEMCAGADKALWAYDILLMDIYLPDGNGIRCGKILREKGFKGVIIYKSSTVDNFPKALEVGAMQYLIKPVSKEKLFETMDSAVEKVMAGPGLNHDGSDDSDVQIQEKQKKEEKRRKSVREFLSRWFHGDKPDTPRE